MIRQSKWSSVLPVISFALAIAAIASAAPQVVPTTTAPSAASSSASHSTCGFKGDRNTYGLGIRIGVYLQWITSCIAYNFVPDEAMTMRRVNTVFTISNFAGLLYMTFTNGAKSNSQKLYAVECWIVLSFCLGGVCSGQVHDSEEGTATSMTFAGYRASAIGRVIQFVVWAAMVYYTIWFLYVGMDKMEHPPCSRFAFFFTKVDLFNWFRIFLKVMFTMSATLFGFAIIVSCFSFMPFLMSRQGLATLISYENPADQSHYPFNFSISFALVFFILSTELVIRWNHISDVNAIQGTEQVLPIVMGGGSLIRVVWKFVLLVFAADDFDS